MWREEILKDNEMEAEEKERKLNKLEEGFWHRRLINADYFKQLKALLLTYDFI